MNRTCIRNVAKELESLIKTNVLGSMYVTKAALPFLRENSKIIFINSVAGLYEFEGQSVYCASKHALTAFSSILSKELKEKKIKTNLLLLPQLKKKDYSNMKKIWLRCYKIFVFMISCKVVNSSMLNTLM